MPDWRVLLVTEKATHRIDAYVVGQDGRASAPISHPSAGQTPFGFAVDRRGRAFVSEAANSTLSSYEVGRAGELTTISAAVANGQAAACWAVGSDGDLLPATGASGLASGMVGLVAR
jgi:hypothetical protein